MRWSVDRSGSGVPFLAEECPELCAFGVVEPAHDHAALGDGLGNPGAHRLPCLGQREELTIGGLGGAWLAHPRA